MSVESWAIPLAALIVALGTLALSLRQSSLKADGDYVVALERRLSESERWREVAERQLEDCRAESRVLAAAIARLEAKQ